MIDNIQATTTLANGVKMPWFGLGVFRANEGREVRNAVSWALDAGYRSIDTASIYDNETGVGKALRASSVPREEIFVTTKVWNSEQRSGHTIQALETSLRFLQLDYVDLYLVHWPVEGYFKQTWRDMEAIYESGKARAIGVSNFLVHHLEALLPEATVVPMVNQVEFHPYLQSADLVAYCREQNIQLEAWSPIMKGKVTQVPELVALGEQYGKNAAQIALRWGLQREVVVIPKSTKQQRIIDNAAVLDFLLSDADMALIDSLEHGYRIGPDPDNFNF
jgi:diketogulonate reductase-like aldo/keto reductase